MSSEEIRRYSILFFFLAFLTSISISDNTKSIEANFDSEKAHQIRLKINKKLELIDDLIRNQEHSQTCKESLEATSIIKENVGLLNYIEPQHNWEKIRALLIAISRKSCH